MAKESNDKRRAREGLAGLGEWPPGALMVTLWFIGMVLVFCLVMALHAAASALAGFYGGG